MPQMTGGFTPVWPVTVNESAAVAMADPAMQSEVQAAPQQPRHEAAAVVPVAMPNANEMKSSLSWQMSKISPG